ncbi:unnamed protein product, partial [Ixodes persulcatus]
TGAERTGGSASVPPVLPQKKNKDAARRNREQLSSAARSSPMRKSQSTVTSKTSSNAGSQQYRQQQQKNKQQSRPQTKQQVKPQAPRIHTSPTKKQFFDEEITPYATFQLSPTKGDHDIGRDDDGEEFRTFTIHHGEPPYMTKVSALFVSRRIVSWFDRPSHVNYL